MSWLSRGLSAGLVALGLGACSREPQHEAIETVAVTEPTGNEEGRFADVAAIPVTPATAEEWARVRQQLQPWTDSADRKLRRIPNLTGRERTSLRRDVNEIQIARARTMGFRVASSVQPYVQSGRLVELAAANEYWTVRKLDYSLPYVTPDTEALLDEIGQRFHAELDRLGVPRFRLDITSVLRTPETQAELRKRNRNASRIESSHEFGTTVDIAYRRFAAPAEHPLAEAEPHLRAAADSTIVEVGRQRGAELQAVLGRVILELQREGKVMVMMERSQTVYHITVAQRMPRQRVVAP
jgi:hypothetical protein